MNKEKAATKKRKSTNSQNEAPIKTLRSTLSEFDWKSLCFFCGFAKKQGNTVLHRVSCSEDLKSAVLEVAVEKNDIQVQSRLALLGEFDLTAVGAVYHKNPCYNTFLSNKKKKIVSKIDNNRSNEQFSNSCDETSFQCNIGGECNIPEVSSIEKSNDSTDEKNAVEYSYIDIMKITLDLFKDRFTSYEIILSTEIYCTYKSVLFEKCKHECTQRTSFLKSKILSLASDYNIEFYCETGLPDLICLKDIPTHYFVRKIHNLLLENERIRNGIDEKREEETRSQAQVQSSDKLILYDAARVLRNDISKITQTKYYPTVDEVKLEYSKSFVPHNLQLFFSWLINQDAFLRATTISDYDLNNQKRMLTFSECLIFSSEINVIPPFHFGLTLQLHHQFGSKFLIDTLNAYGFCATYDELRRFLTALAKKQIAKNNRVYVPPKIISRADGGALIQEGADNVDICTETLDGKDTYHAMARVVFQSQDVDVTIKMEPIERQQEKSLDISNIPFLNMLYYKKPQKKPEPPPYPAAVNKVQTILQNCHKTLRNSDVAWVLLRSFSRGLLNENENEKQVFPNWVAFNMRFSKSKDTATAIQYAPAIHAKPSDLNTVYTTLKKGQELAKECGQSFFVQTYDQQLFALAQFVKFDIPEEMKNAIIRLGSFHTTNTYIACINAIWGDAGLRDMLVDSEVYAGKTVDSMLAGKQFYRAVRGLTLCYEVLVTLLLENFFAWIKQNDMDLDNSLSDVIEDIKIFQVKYSRNNQDKKEFENFINKIDTVIMPRLTEFIEIGCRESPTFKFIFQGLQSIQILLDFIRAERDYDWDSHLVGHTQMLPYFFICNRPNYSRYGPVYVLNMYMNLPDEVKLDFLAGHFSVNFTPGAFKGVFSDMATEMTVIKNTKAADAGITGLTRKPASILRWTLTQNVVGEYAAEMRERSNIKDVNNTYDNYVHEGEKHSLFHRDEEDALKMLNYVKSHMTDPFSLEKYSPSLINISTGRIAPPDVAESLLSAIEVGTEQMCEFLKRLEKTSDKSFYDPITRSKLKTFADIHKQTVYKINGKETRKVINPGTVFKRALLVSDKRPNVNLQMIMSVPLTDIPSEFFKPDGSKRKTCKAELMQLLEKKVLKDVTSVKPALQKYNCIVIDGMAVLQALNTKSLVTFNDVGHQLMEKILRKLFNADEIHLIFDRYDDYGINPKQEERFSRYGSGGQEIEIMGSRQIRDFKKVLANNENKSKLTSFIAEYLRENLPKTEIMSSNENKKVYVAGGIEPRVNTYVISKTDQHIDIDLKCNHVDADTRIIFHVSKIQERYLEQCQIIVESPDTDVFILLVSHYKYFDSKPSIWFYTGKTDSKLDHRRFIPVHKLYHEIGSQKSLALITLHAMSGCDTTSSFNYIGKKKAYAGFSKLSLAEIDDFINIVELPLDKVLPVVTKWLSFIHVPKKLQKQKTFEDDYGTSINNLRYKIASIKDIDVDKLPPSEPALLQHLLRVKWQVNEWSQARSEEIISLNPTLYGWTLNNNILSLNYFEGVTALELLQSFICSCSGKLPCNDENICSCLAQGFDCCDLCSCSVNCVNGKCSNDCIDECEIQDSS